jgi:hypothetical protein
MNATRSGGKQDNMRLKKTLASVTLLAATSGVALAGAQSSASAAVSHTRNAVSQTTAVSVPVTEVPSTPTAPTGPQHVALPASIPGVSYGFDHSGGPTHWHFWVIATYHAIAQASIRTAITYACDALVDGLGYFCGLAVDYLARHVGAGVGTNHGVWAAVYVVPPHITGGLW